jgi:hypothetical protein
VPASSAGSLGEDYRLRQGLASTTRFTTAELDRLVHLAGFGDSVELAWQTESHLPQLPQK